MSLVPSNLISLLRLLDKTLPADEAGRVRERLASEPELADQYRLVLRAMRPAADIDSLLEHAGDLDVSEVAEFVEGRMSAEGLASFEARCWSSEGVLREVIAAWQAVGQTAALEQPAESTDDARAIARSLLRAHPPARRLPRARPLNLPPRAEPPAGLAVDAQDLNGHSHGKRSDAPDRSGARQREASGVGLRLQPARRDPRRRLGRGLEWWLAAVGAAAAALALALYFVSPAGRERTAGSGPGRVPTDGPRETTPVIVRDGSRPNDTDQAPRQRRPANWPSDSDAAPDTDSLAGSEDAPGGNAPGVRPAPPTPPGPEQDVPPGGVRNNAPPGRNSHPAGPPDPRPVVPPAGPPQVALVAWTDVQGVAGDKRAGAAVWSGIHGRSASELWHTNVRSELLTLPSSRVTGVLPGGPRIIADADSLIEMAAAAPPAGATASDLEPIATPRIAVRRGRVAIDGLPSGRRIQVQLDAQLLDVEAALDDSTLAIERVAGETVIAAYHGRVLAGGYELTRRAWARVASDGQLAAFRPQRTTEWYRGAAAVPGLPTDLCLAFNNAADLAQVASRFETSADPTESGLAAQVALRCLAVDGQPISPALLRRLTNSGQESPRLALIEWLLARYRESAALGDADLQVIGTTLQIAPRTTTAMCGWFQSAVRGQRPEMAQLTELVTGLRDPSVFTRQCGKYFLQHILNDPLVEFDPAAPLNRASISLVSRKVRDWQVANQ